MSTDINEARALSREDERANTNNNDSHVDSADELIESIGDILRTSDGKTIEEVAKLCGLDITFVGNGNYLVKHG